MTKAKANRPVPPEELDGEALLEWDRICNELDAAGRLDQTDRAIITLYVEHWAVHRAASKGVNQHGPIIKYTNGVAAVSPFYKAQKEQAAILRVLLNDMGLTPMTRGNNENADAGDLNF